MSLLATVRHDAGRIWRAGVLHIGVSNFLTRVTSLAQRILLARILGAENIGHIAIVTATLSLIRLPAGIGTFTVVNKLVAENTNDTRAQKEVVGTSIYINLVTSLLIVVVSWLVLSRTAWVNDPIANHLLRFLIIFLPLMIFSEVFRNALMGRRRMQTVAQFDILLSLISILIVIPMAYAWSLNGWFANQILVILLGCSLLAWNIRDILSLKWNAAIGIKVATIGSFAFLGQLVGALILQFDTLSVGNILGPAEAGIYNTAALVAQQMLVFPGAILTVVFPVVAQNRNNPQAIKQRYWELFRKIGVLMLGLSLFMWLICPWFFTLFGRDFGPSVIPFRILVLGTIARSLYVLDNTYLDALGRTDITFASGLFAAVCTIILNLNFIPMWGISGAAWATTLSMFLSLALRQLAVHYFIFHKHAVR
jgi:O-antigen/teichoic acid export membrane protein